MATTVTNPEHTVTITEANNSVSVTNNNAGTSVDVTGVSISAVYVSSPGPKGDTGEAGATAATMLASNVVQPFNHITASGNISASGTITALNFTGSLLGTATTASYVTTAQTASYVTTAQTASYVSADNIDQPFTSITAGSTIIQGTRLTTGQIYASSGDFGDGNISNVGSITLDSILPDDGTNVQVGPADGTVKFIVNGHIAGTTKSFIIDHPTKPGKKLQYGSLESPNHSIRLTGKGKILKRDCVIQLPEYLHALVYEEGVNIQITNINHSKSIFIKHVDIPNDNFKVRVNRIITNTELEFFWTLTAERKDVPRIGE